MSTTFSRSPEDDKKKKKGKEGRVWQDTKVKDASALDFSSESPATGENGERIETEEEKRFYEEQVRGTLHT